MYTYSRETYNSNPNNSNGLTQAFLILNLISYLLLLGISAAIYNEKYSEKDKFQYIYYMSKILTIKSIILDNHYTEILDGFSGQNPLTNPTSYRNWLKLVKNKNGCISGYKPCGILDTYGNVLCIDEILNCPINRLKVDNIDKSNYYLSQNYGTVYLNNIPSNYQLFYSNSYEEGSVTTIILKTKDEPKYITKGNFILDSEAFKEIYGDKEFLDKIADVFGLRDDDNNKDTLDKIDDVITIFKKIKDIEDDFDLGDIVLKGAKLLYTILSYEYDKTVEKFNKYVEEQIQILDEKNIDTFYEHIGNNFYAKNYIGFKSVNDIDKFMRFDYNIYKKKFPTFTASGLALGGLTVSCLFILPILFCIFTKKNASLFFLIFFLIFSIITIIFYGFSLGFIIYGLYVYINVNKNKTLDELKSIKADEYINEIITDFISECQKSTLIMCNFIINAVVQK